MQDAIAKTNEMTTATQPYRALFKSLDTGPAIVGCARLIAELLRVDLTHNQILGYVRVLSAAKPEQLIKAFELAESTCKYMPSPGELLALATGGDAGGSMRRADEAFSWIMRYIAHHGVDGRTRMRVGSDYEIHYTRAPAIPSEIVKTLQALGGTLQHGLARVAETKPENLGWLKNDFEAAFMRVEGE